MARKKILRTLRCAAHPPVIVPVERPGNFDHERRAHRPAIHMGGVRVAAASMLATALAVPTTPTSHAPLAAYNLTLQPKSVPVAALPEQCPAVLAPLAADRLLLLAIGDGGQIFEKEMRTDGVDGGNTSPTPVGGRWSPLGLAVGNLRGSLAMTVLPDAGVLISVCNDGRLLAALRSAAGKWGGWQPFGEGSMKGGCAFTPALMACERAVLHVFAVATGDGQLFHGHWRRGAPAAWPAAPMAPPLEWDGLSARLSRTATIDGAVDALGGVQIVVKTADGSLFSRRRAPIASASTTSAFAWAGRTTHSSDDAQISPHWDGWRALDGRALGSPRLAQIRPRTASSRLLEVYSRGIADSMAWRHAQVAVARPLRRAIQGDGGAGAKGGEVTGEAAGDEGGWQWRRESLSSGAPIASSPAVVVGRDGEKHVLALAPDGTVWHRVHAVGGQSTGWSSLGGTSASMPQAFLDASGRLAHALTLGTDSMLYVKAQRLHANGTVAWGEWEALGGPVRALEC